MLSFASHQNLTDTLQNLEGFALCCCQVVIIIMIFIKAEEFEVQTIPMVVFSNYERLSLWSPEKDAIWSPVAVQFCLREPGAHAPSVAEDKDNI